jgi:vacuolar-type H+-ATPase subunit I/STV1
MSLVQLFVPTEVAHDTVAELGELGNVQFKDVRGMLYSLCLLAEQEYSSIAEP